MTTPCDRRSRPRQIAGFTLVEIVVVLLIFSVIIGMAALITRGVTAAQKRSLTATRIATVEAAIVQHVQQQKRLPCPADGTRPADNNNAGIEGARNATGCTNQTDGVVPWRALALSEAEATDGWDRRLTYRVFPALTLDNGMDMSWCDPAGSGALVAGACSATCTAAALGTCTPPTAFLAGKGLQIRNVAGVVIMDPAATPNSGAAYVVISHGESGGGGYLNTGKLMTSTATDGTVEAANNYADKALAAFFVDDTISDVSGATHFDDIVLRPSILSVATKAGLGPRTHQ